MSCSNPSLAVFQGIKENGKQSIRFLPRRVDYSYDDCVRKYGDDLLVLPCGRCEGCILARRKMWSLRCYAESLYHEKNCFITLTYDDEHVPEKLVKKDFQLYIKALRNFGLNVRYFGCGEYGGQTLRPHYHLVLFGYFPDDVKYFSKSKGGFPQFTSKVLSNAWHDKDNKVKGLVTVSEFSPQVAGYVAGYVDKKYKVQDSFILMSKKPGIGEQYFIDHYEEMYQKDSLIVNFGSHVARIPKYFDKLAEKIGFDISDLKDDRLKAMNYQVYKEMRDSGLIHFEELTLRRQRMMKDKLDRKKRGL